MNTDQTFDFDLRNDDNTFGLRLVWNHTADTLDVALRGNDRRHHSVHRGLDLCDVKLRPVAPRTAMGPTETGVPVGSIFKSLEGKFTFSDRSEIRINFNLQPSDNRYVFCELTVEDHEAEETVGVVFAMAIHDLAAAHSISPVAYFQHVTHGGVRRPACAHEGSWG